MTVSGVLRTARSSFRREPIAAKVPEIGALFWLIKVLTTGMGEAASDYLGTLNLVLAGAVGLIGFSAALWWQFRTPRYVAGIYWFAVAMVAVFGTMAADALHVGLGLPYAGSTVFYAGVVGLLFYLWHRSEGTLSIHSIVTRRRELYYWATVLATFALGTAVGDLTGLTLHLGFFASGLLFAAVIAVPALLWWRAGLNEVAAFWAAYVVTRPLGASFADWFGKEHSLSGLGLGDGAVTAVSAVAIVLLVVWAAVRRTDIQRPLASGPAAELPPHTDSAPAVAQPAAVGEAW